MKVSASILAVKTDYYAYAKMLKYAKIDYMHLDIFQNQSVLSLTDILNFDNTYPPMDVHLIYESVQDSHIDILNNAHAKYLNLQYETLLDKKDIEKGAEKFNGNFGIAITAKTPLSVIDKYVNTIQQVLFMCSEPGISGSKFDSSNYERIETIHDRYPSLRIFADGGINDIICKKLNKIGVEMVVSGSYLCQDINQLGANVFSLKYMNERGVDVTRLMIKKDFLPLIRMDAPFIEIINVMNHYSMGIDLIMEGNRLCGIITDGDIRRGYIKFGESIFRKKAKDFMNPHPYSISGDMKIEDVYSEILVMQKGINVVPVMENNELVGAIDLRLGI